jgi:MFS family permease
MKPSSSTTSRNFLIGLAGFIAGGMVGILGTYLLFASGVLPLILKLVPENQPLVRLLLGIILAFVGLGLGGALGGLVRGYTLHQIDRSGSRRRYLWGGAFSSGVTQGVLVIPLLLLISLVSLYNAGSQKEPAFYIIFFGLIGGLFGLVNGALLSLVTLKLRYAWAAWLGYFVASLVAGALLGLMLWGVGGVSSDSFKGFKALLFFVLAGAVLFGLPGGLLGLVYTWASRKRISEPPREIAPRRWQDITTISISTLIFLAVASFLNTGANFLTIYPGNLVTNLGSPTQGIQWQESHQISADLSSQDGKFIGMASNPQELATTWSDSAGEILLATQQSTASDLTVWSGPINVSKSPQTESLHSQVALGENGTAHVVWSENGEIWYNQCQAGACATPVALTGGEQACSPGQNDWPVIALDPGGTLMVAWQAGQTKARPRLAAGMSGEYWMALSGAQDSPGPISLVNFKQGQWSLPETLGEGSTAEISMDQAGKWRAAWCGMDQAVNYLAQDGTAEKLSASSCQSRPSIFNDSSGRIHLVYAATHWQDNFGNMRSGEALMEAIRQPDQTWPTPALLGELSGAVQPETAAYPGWDAHLAWVDGSGGSPALLHAVQPAYVCDEGKLSGEMQALLNVVQSGKFHPAGYQSPFCGNRYDGLVFMPRPLPEVAVLPAGEGNGYDQVAVFIRQAKYEVLLSNMQWDADTDQLSPGARVTEAIAHLYQQVKAHPESYPRGMTVKILLGNYPNLSTLQYGDQIWNVIQDLADEGIETMEDPSIGWKVEVANYKGSYPHSHTKFIVVDGKSLMAAGFNIAWFHLPKDDPSGKGDDLTDLAIMLTGPVAQRGLAVFDDIWQGANQVVCDNLYQGDLKSLQKNCTWITASVFHLPESLKYYLPGSSADAIALFRTADYKESDEAYSAALASAQETIDAMHVNFSADLICMANLVAPGVCDYSDTLPYMHALVAAMENNGAHVRVIVEKANSNGLENRVGIQILEDELARLGLQDHFEARFFDGRLHAKSVIIDGKLLIIGSQNFHYSSFSDGGLLEFVAATDSPDALATYQKMFDYYWPLAIPAEELK